MTAMHDPFAGLGCTRVQKLCAARPKPPVLAAACRLMCQRQSVCSTIVLQSSHYPNEGPGSRLVSTPNNALHVQGPRVCSHFSKTATTCRGYGEGGHLQALRCPRSSGRTPRDLAGGGVWSAEVRMDAGLRAAVAIGDSRQRKEEEAEQVQQHQRRYERRLPSAQAARLPGCPAGRLPDGPPEALRDHVHAVLPGGPPSVLAVEVAHLGRAGARSGA